MGLWHGLLLGGIVVAALFWQFESRVARQLVATAWQHPSVQTVEQQVLALNQLTHRLISTRRGLLTASPHDSLREAWFGGVDTELLEGGRACGGYSGVLGRLLESVDIPFRVLQMRCGDIWSCHVLIEAQVGDRWMALDPSFGTAFPLPEGGHASARELIQRFAEVEPTLPAEYDRQYRFEDVRYTNWDKIPVLMPAMRWTLERILGKGFVDDLSLRTWFINRYRAWFWTLLAVWLPSLWWTMRSLRRAARQRT